MATEHDEDCNEKKARGRSRWKATTAAHDILEALTSTTCSVTAAAVFATSLFVSGAELQSTLMNIGAGYLCVVRPLLATLRVCLEVDDLEDGGSNGATTRIVAAAFLISIVCHQFPTWLSALVASGALFAFGLASASRQPTSRRAPSAALRPDPTNAGRGERVGPLRRTWSRLGVKERAVVGGIAVVSSLLVENFLIWVVSATYPPGIHGAPEPLQDNGRRVMEALAMKMFTPSEASKTVQALRDGLSVQWAIVSAVGASFVCLELQLGKPSPRTLAGLALRCTMTFAAARVIRTISFVLTVLPSQVPNCYARHFPPPPAAWGEWLMIGFLPSSRGGCNDLILSGHAVVTSTLACAFTSTASHASFSAAAWTLIALDYAIEAYQGLHYSVDMWLGCVVTCLLWQLTRSLEGAEEGGGRRHRRGSAGTAPPLTATVAGLYALPAAGAFAILTVVPLAFVNYFLVGYSVWVGVIFAKYGFTNFLQHVLLCQLCFGLGVYL